METDFANEKAKLSRKIYYYKQIAKTKQLNETQQQKFEEYSKRLNELKHYNDESKQQKRKAAYEKKCERSRLAYYNNPKYQYGNLKFINQKTGFEYMSNYLQTHDEIANEDYNDFVCFMSHHHRGFNEAEDTVTIAKDPEHFNSKCFAVKHTDGSLDYRSYRKIFKETK